VRTAAAESLPFLLECARIRGPEYLTQMWQFVCPELLKAVDSEPEQDVKAEHMHAVAQVIIIIIVRLFLTCHNTTKTLQGRPATVHQVLLLVFLALVWVLQVEIAGCRDL